MADQRAKYLAEETKVSIPVGAIDGTSDKLMALAKDEFQYP